MGKGKGKDPSISPLRTKQDSSLHKMAEEFFDHLKTALKRHVEKVPELEYLSTIETKLPDWGTYFLDRLRKYGCDWETTPEH